MSASRGRVRVPGCRSELCALSALLIVLAGGPALPHPAAAVPWEGGAPLPGGPGLRVIYDATGSDPAAAIDRLEGAGFAVPVALAPVYYVRARAGASALPAGMEEAPRSWIRAMPRGGAARSSPTMDDVDPFGGRPDVRQPAAPARRRGAVARVAAAGGLYTGTRWNDTSELLVGRVAVPILFVESDGGIDSSKYDWTPVLRDSIVNAAVNGLLHWTASAEARGIPLSFVLEVHAGLATRYEPIDRPTADDLLWIGDALEPLTGSKGNADEMAYAFANEVRARLGAQWTAIVFAVQNDADPDGAFPDGSIAYARLGGPWFVIPVRNGGGPSGFLEFYMEHEIAHVFWALDEWPRPNAWWGCDLTTGYFNQPNSNSVIPNPGYCFSDTTCVMRGNYPGIVCGPSQAQLGWVDRDHSGVPDLYETHPSVLPDSTRWRFTSGAPIVLPGVALDAAHPNVNPYRFFAGDSITIATIDSVLYRINGGGWISLPPLDGGYDSGREPFAATLGPLAPGQYKVEWQARNSNGLALTAPVSTTVDVSAAPGVGEPPDAASPPPRAVSLSAGPVPSTGVVHFTLQAAPGTVATARLFDAAGRRVSQWSLVAPGTGRAEWSWEGPLRDGGRPRSGLYFLSVDLPGARLTRRVVVLR